MKLFVLLLVAFCLTPLPASAQTTLSSILATKFVLSTTPNCVKTGRQYQQYGGCTLVATGGHAPYTYAWSTVPHNASLPEGLTLYTSTGVIKGTFYGQGAYQTLFTVTDSTGVSASTTIRFAVAGDSTLAGCQLFPEDTIFHTDISNLPVDTSPAAPIWSVYQPVIMRAIFGAGGTAPTGMPFMRVGPDQKNVPVKTVTYQSYFTSGPVPTYAPIEATSNNFVDRHILILQTASAMQPCRLWEMWESKYDGESKGWIDSSNAYWRNLGSTGDGAYEMIPQGKGSTDAAGLPVTPLLVNADEVIGLGTPSAPKGAIKHPIRFSLNHTLNYHVWPATQQSGLGVCKGGYQDGNRMLLQSKPPTSCTAFSPMGEIYRLKASTPTPACAEKSPQSAIIIEGLRHYGMIVADNGISGGLIGTPDSRWNDADLACLTKLHLADFEPVDVSGIAVDLKKSYRVKK